MVKHALVAGGRRLLGEERFSRLAARMGRQAGLRLDGADPWLRGRYAGARVIESAKFVPALLSAQYAELDPNTILPARDVASAYSFVPYYRGCTSLVVYNFFRMNYGIRDPVLYRYMVYEGRKLRWCRQFLMPSDRVAFIADPGAESELPSHGTIVLQAFHPRISTPARQLRFFVLYRDEARGTVSGTHALYFDPQGLSPVSQPSYRGFGEDGPRYSYHSAGAGKIPLAVRQGRQRALGSLVAATQPVAIPGYITRESSDGIPLAIWHDGPSPHYLEPVATKRQIGRSYTAFFVPDFAIHAPLLLVSSSQVGFLVRHLTLRARAEDGREIAVRGVELDHDNATIDLADVFRDAGLAGAVNVIVEFDRDIGEFGAVPTGYLHIYYRGPDGASDQVHSHSTLGVRDDPFRKPRPYRCRKFAPYLVDRRLEIIYGVVNLGVAGRPVHDDSLRVRIFTDRGAEALRTWRLNPSGFTNIRAAELFQGDAPELERAAVVQFEHETTNFNGSWYMIDRASGHLAADHFTGG
jgi:hypothetical protein